MVVDDYVRVMQALDTAKGKEAGIARPRSYEIDSPDHQSVPTLSPRSSLPWEES
jgi:hypothetical protein